MLDVLNLGQPGLLRGGDPHAHGPERSADPARHDRLFLAVLGTAQELLAEVIVNGRVGAAPSRAG
jgi:hypothetical protein